METKRYLACFYNEAKIIGSGNRLVDVKRGRKWAHITNVSKKNLGVRATQKIPLPSWNRIERKALEI